MICAESHEKLSKFVKVTGLGLRPKYCRSFFSGHGVQIFIYDFGAGIQGKGSRSEVTVDNVVRLKGSNDCIFESLCPCSTLRRLYVSAFLYR